MKWSVKPFFFGRIVVISMGDLQVVQRGFYAVR